MQSQNRMISIHFQTKPFNITAIQVCASTTDAREAEIDCLYEDSQHLLKLTHTHTQKDALFTIGDCTAKVKIQKTPGKAGKFGLGEQNEARQKLTVLSKEHTCHGKHPF